MRLGSPEMDALLLVLAAAQMVLLPLALLWVWRATRQVDTRAHVQAVEAAMSQALAELRVAQEGHGRLIAQMPDGKEFADLRVELAALKGKQELVFNEARGARAAARRVEDFLLKAGRHDTQL